ncbi:MAG TPA: SAM-dependent methyltransferase [Candidatus Udaeobacter sp.]|nr:SAM-dependent methyltransferase [Candidatus Udaeobacter sp.]
MSPTEPPIENVSDTARWVAVYRAMESDRRDALFRDPWARRLAGERGVAIVRAMPNGRALAWPMIVRTAVMDEMIASAIRGGTRTVLNLAAGLDTRAWRLDLPKSLRWIDADLPAMIAYRDDMMRGETPVCRHESVAADLREAGPRRELFAHAASEGETLVITEGLLIYLTADQVRSLAGDLHREPMIRGWISDLASPFLIQRVAKSWQSKLTAGGAPFQFAPAEGTKFFEPLGWREVEFRSTWLESKRLKREMPMAWLWKILGTFMPAERRREIERMSAIIRLERM